MEQAAASHTEEFLSFRNGREEYGIDILQVQEIRGYEAPTHIANAPPHVLGVLNLRGVIVPILDMRRMLAMAAPTYDQHTVTIVLNLAQRALGLVVDSVSDVVALLPGDIKPAPDLGDASAASYVTGIASLQQGAQERMLTLVDVAQFLAAAGAGVERELA